MRGQLLAVALLSCLRGQPAGTLPWPPAPKHIAYEILGFSLEDRMTIHLAMREVETAAHGRIRYENGPGGLRILALADRAELADAEWPRHDDGSPNFRWLGLWIRGRQEIDIVRPMIAKDDLRRYVLHELGHALGLRHTAAAGSCMREFMDANCVEGGLSPVDLQLFEEITR